MKLDSLAVKLNGADFEVNTDGGDVRLGVGVVGETQQQTRLSDSGIANEQKFEEVIAKKQGKLINLSENLETYYSGFIAAIFCVCCRILYNPPERKT